MEKTNEISLDRTPPSGYYVHPTGWYLMDAALWWCPMDAARTKASVGGTHWVPLLLIKATGEKSPVVFF